MVGNFCLNSGETVPRLNCATTEKMSSYWKFSYFAQGICSSAHHSQPFRTNSRRPVWGSGSLRQTPNTLPSRCAICNNASRSAGCISNVGSVTRVSRSTHALYNRQEMSFTWRRNVLIASCARAWRRRWGVQWYSDGVVQWQWGTLTRQGCSDETRIQWQWGLRVQGGGNEVQWRGKTTEANIKKKEEVKQWSIRRRKQNKNTIIHVKDVKQKKKYKRKRGCVTVKFKYEYIFDFLHGAGGSWGKCKRQRRGKGKDGRFSLKPQSQYQKKKKKEISVRLLPERGRDGEAEVRREGAGGRREGEGRQVLGCLDSSGKVYRAWSMGRNSSVKITTHFLFFLSISSFFLHFLLSWKEEVKKA